MGPVLLGAACVDHDLYVWAYGLSGRSDQELIVLVAHPAETVPSEFDGSETPGCRVEQLLFKPWRLIKEEGTIRLYFVPVISAQQARDGLAGHLAQDIPEGYVDSADGVGHGASPSLPECELVELFR